jgi:hypothetical protein
MEAREKEIIVVEMTEEEAEDLVKFLGSIPASEQPSKAADSLYDVLDELLKEGDED